MKILVFWSGGKDSQASLIWAIKEYGIKHVQAVFCDTHWEHPVTYQHVKDVAEQSGVEIITLKSQKYDGMVDLAVKKKRFPSTKARFCTEELKSIPTIDYVLSLNDNAIVIQGIRADESHTRAKMASQCQYFKYYFQPYGHDKNGKPKFHTYRKKDVIAYCSKFNADIIRPVFDWSGQQTIDYIRENGQYPNPLYSMGFSRVGCFPCIMARHGEVLNIIKNFPKQWQGLKDAENKTGRSFFPPKYIPLHQSSGVTENGKKFTTTKDVEKYLLAKNATGDLFKDESEGFSCMSYYGLCE